jgi:hypothetical protein
MECVSKKTLDLEVLDLCGACLDDDNAGMMATKLLDHPSLEHVYLDSNGFTEESSAAFAHWVCNNRRIRTLSFKNNEFDLDIFGDLVMVRGNTLDLKVYEPENRSELLKKWKRLVCEERCALFAFVSSSVFSLKNQNQNQNKEPTAPAERFCVRDGDGACLRWIRSWLF